LQHALPVKTSSYREASSIDSDEEGTLEDDESVDLDGETVLDEGEEDDNEHHCLEVIASQGSNSIKVRPATASFLILLTFFQMECDDLNQHILYMATQPGLRVRLIVRGEWAHLVFAKDKPTREELAIVNEQTYPEKRLEVRERVDPTLSDGETVVEVRLVLSLSGILNMTISSRLRIEERGSSWLPSSPLLPFTSHTKEMGMVRSFLPSDALSYHASCCILLVYTIRLQPVAIGKTNVARDRI
jgi:hypothetical protein